MNQLGYFYFQGEGWKKKQKNKNNGESKEFFSIRIVDNGGLWLGVIQEEIGNVVVEMKRWSREDNDDLMHLDSYCHKEYGNP